MIKFKPRNRKTSMKKRSIAHLHRRSCAMVMGSFYLPKQAKSSRRRNGEDAHFLCREKSTLGLADGVGGWVKKGIDSGKYARELLKNSVAALDREIRGAVNLRRVLEEAFCMTKSSGSSTACIVTLRDHHLHDLCLYSLIVGDSGFMLFRNGKCVFQSPSQQHGFNRPYQLGNSGFGDGPDVAAEIVVPVEFGDLVVAGTDGLLDNMFPYEIEEILSRTEDDTSVGKLAWTIAKHASFNATDRYSDSPFSRASKLAERATTHLGGKMDDISVIVAKII